MPVARKEHSCSFCQKPIQVGERYARLAIGPWHDGEGDVDDEGRNIWVEKPRGERRWMVIKACARCLEKDDVYEELGYYERWAS